MYRTSKAINGNFQSVSIQHVVFTYKRTSFLKRLTSEVKCLYHVLFLHTKLTRDHDYLTKQATQSAPDTNPLT